MFIIQLIQRRVLRVGGLLIGNRLGAVIHMLIFLLLNRTVLRVLRGLPGGPPTDYLADHLPEPTLCQPSEQVAECKCFACKGRNN